MTPWSPQNYRIAAFWASVVVVLGLLLAVGGLFLAVVALLIDMPWGQLTGQAVLERLLAAFVLAISGAFAGAPFVVVGKMLRVFLDQRDLLERIATRLDEQAGAPPR